MVQVERACVLVNRLKSGNAREGKEAAQRMLQRGPRVDMREAQPR